MSRLLAVTLAIALCSTLARAPHADPSDAPAAPEAPPNHWAFEFGLSGISLTSFRGANLALRRQTSDHAAWRLGVSGNYSSDNGTSNGVVTGASTQGGEDDQRVGGASISIARLTYPSRDGSLRPYLGLGPNASVSRASDHRVLMAIAPGGTSAALEHVDGEVTSYAVSLAVIAGCEWRVMPRLAIHAEYSEAGGYDWSREDTSLIEIIYPSGVPQSSSGTAKSHGWSVNGSAVSGVSVFF